MAAASRRDHAGRAAVLPLLSGNSYVLHVLILSMILLMKEGGEQIGVVSGSFNAR